MEQNILKRYNEIHVMLWEEVIKVFSARTNESIEYYKANQEQINTLFISYLKRKALLNLFVRGKITEFEKNRLLMSSDCAACYIADFVQSIEFILGNSNWSNIRCEYCPIKKWNTNIASDCCKDYHVLEDKLDNLIRYIVKCTSNKGKFNIRAYTKLRKAVIKKAYIIAHLEWGYEENGK